MTTKPTKQKRERVEKVMKFIKTVGKKMSQKKRG